MTRGKQKIESQRRNAERNQKAKGSQLEARAVALKVICPICKVSSQFLSFVLFFCLQNDTSIVLLSILLGVISSSSSLVLYHYYCHH